jgi:integrase
MLDPQRTCGQTARWIPWNKGKLVGAKPPLLLKHIWSIRSKLRVDGRIRDLAMFNLAIDSKLRGCDVVSIKVEDIAPLGVAIARATVRQRKTGRNVRFELTEQTRETVDEYLRVFGRKPGDPLFPSRRHKDQCITTRQYARLVSGWISSFGLDASFFARTRFAELRRLSSSSGPRLPIRCAQKYRRLRSWSEAGSGAAPETPAGRGVAAPAPRAHGAPVA